MRRLFWRSGFGATPTEAKTWAARGREATIRHVVRGGGSGLRGPKPRIDGKPLDPANEWAHDVLWWLDRMVRTQHPLREKMTLFWHDHFATREQDTPLMLAQNRMLRRRALGRYRELLGAVTRDPAMQLFLSLAGSTKSAPNENYARELFELFTIGTGHSERDVREASRALTGWVADWGDNGLKGIAFKPEEHDDGVKQIFGRSGRLSPDDVLDLAVAHPRHPRFLVKKLWAFFVTEPLPPATRRRLERTYRASKGEIRPVVEQILRHPALYARLDAPDMVKSPVVHVAGLLRTAGIPIERDAYGWVLDQMGQFPFQPPTVAGWEWGEAWMSSGTLRARQTLGNVLIGWDDGPLDVPDREGDPTLAPAEAVDRALRACGEPWISDATRRTLERTAAGFFDDMTKPWDEKHKPARAAMLQRVLRHLLISGPDAHLH